MHRKSRGFSFIELTIVVMILGILVAIAMPSFGTMQERAKEGSTKANMHTFQLAAEAYAAENHGTYAPTANGVAALLPGAGSEFHNPFDHSTGDLKAWEDVAVYSPSMGTGSALPGIVAYADSATVQYVIAGRGAGRALDLRLYGARWTAARAPGVAGGPSLCMASRALPLNRSAQPQGSSPDGP